MKTLLILTLIFSITKTSQAQQKSWENLSKLERSFVCNIIDHPIYDKTAVFGTGTPQIFFIRKDRLESKVHHTNIQVLQDEDGYYVITNGAKTLLFSINNYAQGFVNVIGVDEEHGLDMESGDYKVDGCIAIE